MGNTCSTSNNSTFIRAGVVFECSSNPTSSSNYDNTRRIEIFNNVYVTKEIIIRPKDRPDVVFHGDYPLLVHDSLLDVVVLCGRNGSSVLFQESFVVTGVKDDPKKKRKFVHGTVMWGQQDKFKDLALYLNVLDNEPILKQAVQTQLTKFHVQSILSNIKDLKQQTGCIERDHEKDIKHTSYRIGQSIATHSVDVDVDVDVDVPVQSKRSSRKQKKLPQ